MKTGLRDRIGSLLVQRKLITPEQLNQALEAQKEKRERLGELLVGMGFLSKDQLLQVLSEEMGIPSVALARTKVEPDTAKIISKKLADLHCILPVASDGETLSLAMSDPLNVHAIDDVKRATGLNVKPMLAIDKDIREAIEACWGENVSEAIKDVMKDIAGEDGAGIELREGEFQNEGSAQDLLRLTEEEPVVKLTNSIMVEGVKRRSSDIFIEPEEKNLRVRFRVDGLLQEGLVTSRAMHAGVVSRIKVISNLDIAEHRIPQDGRFKMKVKDKYVDFRVSVLPTYFGEKVVLRILDKSGAILDLERLGFEPEPLLALKKAAMHPHGMIVVCGPTGAGKTTTLYSALKLVDKPEINIVTVEDPVEFQIEGINQVAIRSEVELTFARALRAILRQDPDVIMVGEIRDGETADVAIKAALTGHLVLSTLHATTAAGAVTRLLNMGIEPFLITSSVLLAGSQRLVRKICLKCREAYEPSKELLKQMGVTDKHLNGGKPQFFRGKGCEACSMRGYSGRAVLLEALSMSPQIKGMILKGAAEHELKKVGRAEGMLSLRENGIKKTLSGVTTPEEVMRVTVRDED